MALGNLGMNNLFAALSTQQSAMNLGTPYRDSSTRDSSTPIGERLARRKADLEMNIAGAQKQLELVNEAIRETQEHPHVTRLLDVLGKLGMGV